VTSTNLIDWEKSLERKPAPIEVAVLEGRLFSSQSGLFENFSDCFDWLDKSWPSKKATFVLIISLFT